MNYNNTQLTNKPMNIEPMNYIGGGNGGGTAVNNFAISAT